MQAIIVFIIYIFLFNWLITRIYFFKQTGLGNRWLIMLFSLKVIAGLAYAWFYMQPAYINTSDTFSYFKFSKEETDWLLKDPAAFLKDIFVYGYQQSGSLFAGENSYWNDLKDNLIIKLLAICNVFTFKNYYADIIFFNFIFFFGPAALYRVTKQVLETNKSLLTVIIFLIPSFLFWCSGIHKDGLVFTFTAIIIFHFYKQLQHKKIISASLIISILCFMLLFALRNFMALLLLPALAVWYLCKCYPARAKLIVVLIYGTGSILFFLSGYISPETDMPQYIIEKQAEFKQLSGASEVQVPVLENSITGFIKFLPTAIDIVFFRPHIADINNSGYIPAATEVLLLWGIAITSLFVRNKKKAQPQQAAFLFFCICFSISFLLLAGYTITFSGAIVRYRAVVLPFLFIPVLQQLNLQKIPFLKKAV
ncbi:MAG TPA: hypothetical protein PLA68_07475 [Panacibacter sp.]|nr:hypothetical protein [Panacibacter sp.]